MRTGPHITRIGTALFSQVSNFDQHHRNADLHTGLLNYPVSAVLGWLKALGERLDD
jgi:hypothetical protein